MAFVITEPCIGVKDGSCIEVCPVDCIHPTPADPAFEEVEQLYIDPEVCIDCKVCAAVCPVDAIFEEDEVPERWGNFTERNASYSRSRDGASA
jgi:NAD-dependent dihydropyrimidine dehydrogenase PreA subunit